MTFKLREIFLITIVVSMFTQLLSCDSYNSYSVLNNTREIVIVKTDQSHDIISEFNKEISLDSSGSLLIKPSQEYVLFKGVNNLNESEVRFTYLIIVTQGNDTIVSLKSKDAILEYFEKQSVLKIK